MKCLLSQAALDVAAHGTRRSRRARFMTAKHLLLLLLMSAVGPVTLLAQGSRPSSPDPEEPLLTLDHAVSLALDNNRGVKISGLEAQRAVHQVNIARSKRLPQFRVDALAGSLLQPFDFTFPAGSFGTYPETGPIPSTDAKIRTDAQFTSFVTAAVDQPL